MSSKTTSLAAAAAATAAAAVAAPKASSSSSSTKRAALPLPVTTTAEATAKRARLFQAMEEASLGGEVMPSLEGASMVPMFQFALAIDRLLQNQLRPRMGLLPKAADARHVARAVLTQYVEEHPADAAFVAEVLAFVDADARVGEEEEEESVVVDADAPPPPALPRGGRLRLVMPRSRATLVELALVGVDQRQPQRDCVYQSLLFLRGLLARPLTAEDAARRRSEALQQFRRQWAAAFAEEERARARRLEMLQAEPAAWEAAVKAADAAVAQAERAVAEAVAESDAVRVETDARFAPVPDEDDDMRDMRTEWVKLCAQRQQFWAHALAKARAAVAARRVAADEARARQTALAECHQAKLAAAEQQEALPTQEQTEARVLVHVDAQLARLRAIAGWGKARDAWFAQMTQHEDVLADAHLTVCARAQRMLGRPR